MEEIKLDVQIRENIGRRRLSEVRSEGFVPAVVYGGDHGPTVIKVNRGSYERIMRHHRGQSVLFHLDVMEGEKKLRDYSAIVKEEQHHPVSDELVHIDFKRISLKEEIEVKVPIAVHGEAIGVKRDGGSLEHVLWELDVYCLPTNIPANLDLDISALEIGDAIHVKDISFPEGVKTHHDPEAVVVAIAAPMNEEVETGEEQPEEPEVIGSKKDDEASDEDSEKSE